MVEATLVGREWKVGSFEFNGIVDRIVNYAKLRGEQHLEICICI